jgi:hypothetical protein
MGHRSANYLVLPKGVELDGCNAAPRVLRRVGAASQLCFHVFNILMGVPTSGVLVDALEPALRETEEGFKMLFGM